MLGYLFAVSYLVKGLFADKAWVITSQGLQASLYTIMCGCFETYVKCLCYPFNPALSNPRTRVCGVGEGRSSKEAKTHKP